MACFEIGVSSPQDQRVGGVSSRLHAPFLYCWCLWLRFVSIPNHACLSSLILVGVVRFAPCLLSKGMIESSFFTASQLAFLSRSRRSLNLAVPVECYRTKCSVLWSRSSGSLVSNCLRLFTMGGSEHLFPFALILFFWFFLLLHHAR